MTDTIKHTTTVIRDYESPGRKEGHEARCSCGWNSGEFLDFSNALEIAQEHERDQERIAYLENEVRGLEKIVIGQHEQDKKKGGG